MISWIQKYFQQHFRIVFAILLIVVIISFVFVIGASPGIGRAERQAVNVPFFGLNLGSQADQQKIFGDAQLSILLQAGFPALEGGQMQEYAFFRQASLSLANRLNIPAPTPTALAEHVQTLRIFAGETGAFDVKRYDDFRANPRRFLNVSETEISRVLADDVRVNRVQKLLGGPGYVLATDVKTQLERFESTWTLAVASVDYKTFSTAITPTDAVLAKYFEDNADRYEIPPQVVVQVAEFPATSYLAGVNVTEADVKAFYDANPARFPKPADKVDEKKIAPVTPADPIADYAAVRSQVELALRIERASRAAVKAASDFTLALFEQKIVPGTPAFDALLASHKISLKGIPPFSHDNPPAALGENPDAADEAFRLSKDRLYSDAIAVSTGSIVLFWKETIPERQPMLAEIRTKVSADYIENEKHQRFATLGKTLRSQLEARLKAGDSFEKAVAAVASSSSVKIEPKTYAPFTLRQRPQDLDYLVLGTLESLQKGGLSEMAISPEKGLFVHAIDKKSPDLSETSPQYQSARTQIAQVVASRNSNEYLREMVEAELAKSKSPTP